MAGAPTSYGYPGSIDSAVLAAWLPRAAAARFSVVGKDDWKVTAQAGLDRGIRINAGTGIGDGVMDVFPDFDTRSLPIPAGSSQWFLIVARRNWSSPASTNFAIVPGTAAKAMPVSGVNDTPGQVSDQPIALVRVQSNSTVVAEIVDLRAWAGNGGVEAVDIMGRDILARPGAAVKVGPDIHRYEYTATNGGSFAWKVYSEPKLVHLELDYAAARNIAGSLWGPGSPTAMAAGINKTASSNWDQFSFPLNNEIRVAQAGVYAISWAVTGFDKPTGALMLISKDANGQILASNSIGDGSRDITASRANIYLPAGAIVQFNFQTGQAVTCRHLLSITKIG